jgi:hypothetical protein
LWVSWKFGKSNITSRVEDFSASGAFIASQNTLEIGTRLKLLFSMPEGEIPVQAVVRNLREGQGMGVEFISMGGREFELILKAVKRLLSAGDRDK